MRAPKAGKVWNWSSNLCIQLLADKPAENGGGEGHVVLKLQDGYKPAASCNLRATSLRL